MRSTAPIFILRNIRSFSRRLKQAYKSDKPADVHLVCEALKRADQLDTVGGVSYVTALAQYAGTSAYIEQYSQLIQDKSMLRRMVSSCQEVEKAALEDPDDVQSLLDEAQQKFFQISQTANSHFGIAIKEILTGVKSAPENPTLKSCKKDRKITSNGDLKIRESQGSLPILSISIK